MTKPELDLMECLRKERVATWGGYVGVGPAYETAIASRYRDAWRHTPAADLPREFLMAKHRLERHRDGRSAD